MDLPSSIHCAPALDPLASLYNSAFAMGPHLFTVEQKRIRINRSRELLHVLSVRMSRQWHDIVTLD
jgi:hypothetical protein